MENVDFVDIAECFYQMNDRTESNFLVYEEIEELLLGEDFLKTVTEKLDVSKCDSVSKKGLYYQFVI